VIDWTAIIYAAVTVAAFGLGAWAQKRQEELKVQLTPNETLTADLPLWEIRYEPEDSRFYENAYVIAESKQQAIESFFCSIDRQPDRIKRVRHKGKDWVIPPFWAEEGMG
jgi:hypothetical protein